MQDNLYKNILTEVPISTPFGRRIGVQLGSEYLEVEEMQDIVNMLKFGGGYFAPRLKCWVVHPNVLEAVKKIIWKLVLKVYLRKRHGYRPKRFSKHVPPYRRAEVMKLKGNLCEICGNAAKRCHHIVPLKFGGSNEIDNLMVLCIPCHKKVHDSYENAVIEEFLKKDPNWWRDVLRRKCLIKR